MRKRTLVKGPAYFFVTANTSEHAPLFVSEKAKQIVEERLLRTAVEQNLIVIAYVVMSTHLHFVCYLPESGIQLSNFMFSIKGRIRKDLCGDKKIWQDRFDGKLIKSDKMLADDITYVHYNPVKAGLVSAPEDYRFSSAGIWSGICSDDRVSTKLDY